MIRLLPLCGLLALCACHNPCQRLCVQMAEYAEECGITVPESELSACIEAEADPLDKGACRRVGGADTLRSEWTCEDVAAFFD